MVLDPVLGLEGFVVGLDLVPHLEGIVLPLGLVVPEELVVEGWVSQPLQVCMLLAALVSVVLSLIFLYLLTQFSTCNTYNNMFRKPLFSLWSSCQVTFYLESYLELFNLF